MPMRLLCVTAHPDDEAGAFGGTLLLYGERGVELHLVCLTAGTAARNRGTARTDEELAQLRRSELAESCQILGISKFEVLDYPDSRLDRVDFRAVVGELVLRIRQIRPQVVLTFGPDGGMTGHPDHAMAGTLATQAVHWAGRTDRYSEQLAGGLTPHRAQKLYYHATDFLLPDRQPVAPVTVTAHVEIGPERFEKKIAAFMRHRTQEPLFNRLRKNLGQRPHTEMYHLAATDRPSTARFETDLLDGVTEE